MENTMQNGTPAAEAGRGWLAARWPTIRSVLLGALSWPIAALLAWNLWPADGIASPALPLALQLCVAPATLLLVMVFACMRLYDKPEALNPFLGAESQRWKLNARVLQNTLEQAAIFVPILLGLSVRLNPAHVRILPILVLLWCAGRLMFWVGIHIDLAWRGLGFNWTFASSVCALIWFACTLF